MQPQNTAVPDASASRCAELPHVRRQDSRCLSRLDGESLDLGLKYYLLGVLGHIREEKTMLQKLVRLGLPIVGLIGALASPAIGQQSGTNDATGCYGAPTNCAASTQAVSRGTGDHPWGSRCSGESRKIALAGYGPSERSQSMVTPRLAQAAIRPNRDSLCAANGVRCIRLEKQVLSSWKSTSAAWDAKEEELIVPCILQGRVLSYEANSGRAAELPLLAYRGLKPVVLKRHYDELVIEYGDGHLLVYDEELKEVKQLSLVSTQNELWQVGSIRDWHYLGSELIALAEIYPPDHRADIGKWRFAVVRFGWEQAGDLQLSVLWDTELTSPAREYSLFANSYLAEVRGGVFAFLAGRPSQILRYLNGQVDVFPMPNGLSSALDVKERSKSDLSRAYREIELSLLEGKNEDSVFAAGLIGWQGKLFLFHRRVEGSGEHKRPVWVLTRLSIGSEVSARNEALLPSLGSRVILVPGRRAWAILEFDEVALHSRGAEEVHPPNQLKIWDYVEAEYPSLVGIELPGNIGRTANVQESGR